MVRDAKPVWNHIPISQTSRILGPCISQSLRSNTESTSVYTCIFPRDFVICNGVGSCLSIVLRLLFCICYYGLKTGNPDRIEDVKWD